MRNGSSSAKRRRTPDPPPRFLPHSLSKPKCVLNGIPRPAFSALRCRAVQDAAAWAGVATVRRGAENSGLFAKRPGEKTEKSRAAGAALLTGKNVYLTPNAGWCGKRTARLLRRAGSAIEKCTEISAQRAHFVQGRFPASARCESARDAMRRRRCVLQPSEPYK